MSSVIIDRRAGLSSATAIKGPCRVATTENIVLSGQQTIDGVSLRAGDRVLVKDQDDITENGAYLVDTGDWSRVKDFSRNDDVVNGTRVVIVDGETNALTTWQVVTDDQIAFGSSGILFIRADVNSAIQYNFGYRVYMRNDVQYYVDHLGRILTAVLTGVPENTSSVGSKGSIRFDADYFYVCVEDNTWKRVGLSSW